MDSTPTPSGPIRPATESDSGAAHVGSDASASPGMAIGGAGVCPVCRTPVANDDGNTVECMHCRLAHHKDCWDYNGGCGSYGCPSCPPTDRLNELEVPASFWGQDEKECPVCHARIQAAALRCRACGTVFNTARPQDTGEFQQRRTLEQELPKLRRQSIILLVFSVIPCTAVLAAIGGGIWYAARRSRIAALPAQQAALPKIALGVAIAQSVLLVVVLVLHALFAH